MSKRVLAASIMHETNTFSRLATDLQAFRQRYDHRGDAIGDGIGVQANPQASDRSDAAVAVNGLSSRG